MMDSNLLRGDLVRLTALDEQDVPVVTRWYEDVGYLRLQDTNFARPLGREGVAAELKQLGEGNNILLAIRTVNDDALIGTIGFYEIEWSNQTAWLGVGIGDRENWGKGYGGEAMRLLLRYAFCELNLYRLQLTVLDYNARAIALYEKLAFRREGVFRQFGQRDGKRYDMYLYGLLRPEWEAAA
jgi:RimJ/RimL family protein N-acetyltransferase